MKVHCAASPLRRAVDVRHSLDLAGRVKVIGAEQRDEPVFGKIILPPSIALVQMGDALGLYKTLHQKGPMTTQELATEAG